MRGGLYLNNKLFFLLHQAEILMLWPVLALALLATIINDRTARTGLGELCIVPTNSTTNADFFPFRLVPLQALLAVVLFF